MQMVPEQKNCFTVFIDTVFPAVKGDVRLIHVILAFNIGRISRFPLSIVSWSRSGGSCSIVMGHKVRHPQKGRSEIQAIYCL